MKGWKNNNDPWEPLPDHGNSDSSLSHTHDESCSCSSISISIPSCPQNPLHSMIDSQHYIQTLEKRLEQLKKKKENPSSKDIITSLALFQDDQMRNYVNSDSSSFSTHNIDETDRNLTSSYMKRKLFPELQAVNATELVELVQDDFVGKVFEQIKLEDQPNLDTEKEAEVGNEDNGEIIAHDNDSELNVEQINERNSEKHEL